MHSSRGQKPKASPELQEAQRRLYKLREEFLSKRDVSHNHSRIPTYTQTQDKQLEQSQKELSRRWEQQSVGVNHGSPYPSSNWIASLLKQCQQPHNSPASEVDQDSPLNDETVPVYPSILTAMLKQHLEAAGRIYLLLYHLDPQGRGWLSLEYVRSKLAGTSSSLRVCGWRRLRQLLHQGEDIFWQRDRKGRIWLRGAAKIAQKLGLARLQGLRLDLPVKTLLGGIQAVRAHFYAAFHSGRKKGDPISRERLQKITSIPGRTQRAYDKISGTERQHNMAIGPRYNKHTAEEQAWQRGRGAFHFIDSKSQQGAPNGEYVAWHLPNSYQGPHSKRPKGRQKRINQQLNSLVDKGRRGNVSERVEKLFWPDGGAAGQSYNRDGEHDAYWPQGHDKWKARLLWYVLPGG